MQNSNESKPSIADLRSLDPERRAAARREFVQLAFVDEQTKTCERCPGHPPMVLYFRVKPVLPGPEHAYQTRIAEICSVCSRGSPSGGMWINKERCKAVLMNTYEFHQYMKEHGD